MDESLLSSEPVCNDCEKVLQGCRRTKHKTYSILDNQWVIMSTSNRFHYFKKFTAQLIFEKAAVSSITLISKTQC